MNMLKYMLLISISLFMFLNNGCCNGTENSKVSSTSQYPNDGIYWREEAGHFLTNDIDRAQEHIPFTIIFPTYIPNQDKSSLPQIWGPLDVLEDSRIEVRMAYSVYYNPDKFPGAILITEGNQSHNIGDPAYNDDLEISKIHNIQVTKTKEDFSRGSISYFAFNSDGMFYVIEFHDVTHDEAIKVIESMVRQLD